MDGNTSPLSQLLTASNLDFLIAPNRKHENGPATSFTLAPPLSLKLSFVPDPQKQLTLELGYLGVAPLCQMKWSVDFHAATFLCLLKNFRAWPRQKSLKRWAVENKC